MKKTLLLFLVLFIFGCNPSINYINGHKIIRYGTTEFKNFEKKTKIKKEQAWSIQNEITSKQQVPVVHWLFFIIDENYVFTSVVNSTKKETELIGICVNSETGIVTYEKSGVRLKYKNAYILKSEKFPF